MEIFPLAAGYYILFDCDLHCNSVTAQLLERGSFTCFIGEGDGSSEVLCWVVGEGAVWSQVE